MIHIADIRRVLGIGAPAPGKLENICALIWTDDEKRHRWKIMKRKGGGVIMWNFGTLSDEASARADLAERLADFGVDIKRIDVFCETGPAPDPDADRKN